MRGLEAGDMQELLQQVLNLKEALDGARSDIWNVTSNHELVALTVAKDFEPATLKSGKDGRLISYRQHAAAER